MLKLEDQMLNDNLDSLFSGELGGGTGSDAGERGGGARPSGCERDGGRRQCGYKYGQVVTTSPPPRILRVTLRELRPAHEILYF